jgi:hypothetical protein
VALRPRTNPPRRDPPAWFVWLVGLVLAATAVLWPLLTGRTLTEWTRAVTSALVRR